MDGLLHYEDFAEGETRDLGAYPVTRDEIVAFAREFDPQDFHLDEEAGRINQRQAELGRRLQQLDADIVREERMVADNADILERLSGEERTLNTENAGAAGSSPCADDGGSCASARRVQTRTASVRIQRNLRTAGPLGRRER